MSLKRLVRPEILDLPTINVPEALPEMIRLNANESPTSHWNDALNHSLHRYPPIRPYSIVKIIADLFEVQNDQILLSRGSTEAIDIIIKSRSVAVIVNLPLLTSNNTLESIGKVLLFSITP